MKRTFLSGCFGILACVFVCSCEKDTKGSAPQASHQSPASNADEYQSIVVKPKVSLACVFTPQFDLGSVPTLLNKADPNQVIATDTASRRVYFVSVPRIAPYPAPERTIAQATAYIDSLGMDFEPARLGLVLAAVIDRLPLLSCSPRNFACINVGNLHTAPSMANNGTTQLGILYLSTQSSANQRIIANAGWPSAPVESYYDVVCVKKHH